MDLDLAEKITERLIGVSVTFSQRNQTIYYNPYLKITLSSSASMNINGDSYYQFGFDFFGWVPNLSFDIFSINFRAKELGIRLNGLIDDGEICVSSSYDYIVIKVCVFKGKGKYWSSNGSIMITIILPSNQLKESKKKNADVVKLEEAFSLGSKAVAAFLLFKIIKGGIGAIFGGPLGAAVGFAC